MSSFIKTVADGDTMESAMCATCGDVAFDIPQTRWTRGGRAITRLLLASLVAIPLMAASADRGLNLSVPAPGSSLPVPPSPPANAAPSKYQPAPTPNRDVELGPPAKPGTAPSVAPSLFTRQDQYRGEGFGKGSTAQSEQDKRVRPGAGLSLHLPLSPN